MNDLKDRVALITGASSGIGAATAILFARLGAKMSLTGRNKDNLKRVIEECTRVVPAETEPPLMVLAELCSEAQVTNLVDTTIKKFGRLDILVNNAGIFEFGSIETTSMAQYDRIMNVNVRSVYHLTTLCVPHLIKTRGNIVNVSSVGGTRSFAGELVYGMSKSAIDQMTSCTALELAAKGVRVNSVNPGLIVDTEAYARAGLSGDDFVKFVENMNEKHPLQRVGKSAEVAHAIAFLASGNASFVTGEHIHVDGGLHAVCLR